MLVMNGWNKFIILSLQTEMSKIKKKQNIILNKYSNLLKKNETVQINTCILLQVLHWKNFFDISAYYILKDAIKYKYDDVKRK